MTPPSDDPADWDVDASRSYRPVLGAPSFVIPSSGLPDSTPTGASNNNVGITFHQDRLFMGWRTDSDHWPSDDTLMYIVSSPDGGATWEHEYTIDMGSDVREPIFYVMNDRLFFLWFQGGALKVGFSPKKVWRVERTAFGEYTEPEEVLEEHEVPWDARVRDGKLYLTSYLFQIEEGDGPAGHQVRLRTSDDGVTFSPEGAAATVYTGGASESSFEFDADGDLWAVMRNESGDESGFGSLVCHADKDDLWNWDCPAQSHPHKYDSPRMLRHGDELYLVARRNVDGAFDLGRDDLPISERRVMYNVTYWNSTKRTALYRIDRDARMVEHIQDLPGWGDTAFPSIRRTGAHTFLIANYTSPLEAEDMSWNQAQGSIWGTDIYLAELRFEAE